MGAGVFVEPSVVVGLLIGGTWINRASSFSSSCPRGQINDGDHDLSRVSHEGLFESLESGLGTPTAADAPLANYHLGPISLSLLSSEEPSWRKREIRLWKFRRTVVSPNTRIFRGRLMSRLLLKFPFLVECWYWALLYWTNQLGRAFTAIQVQNGTVHVARGYALQIIHLEKDLRIFWELQIQGFFLQQSFLMIWINRIYSFIHIPGTILFLIWLYYYTTTRNEVFERQVNEGTQIRLGYRIGKGLIAGSPKGPLLYEARRRTMGMCNLLAFVISTIWPCMPPRLLSDKSYKGSMGNEASSYNFVDTVYGIGGESIVWKENKFSTQYAAMPSLHFGYALMIGLTIIMIPLPHHHRRSKSIPVSWINPFRAVAQYHIDFPPWRRMLCITVGVFTILIAVLATANHFILDALVGALVCGLGWWTNMILLNLVPLEDYFLWCLRVYKPEGEIIPVLEGYDKEDLLVEKAVVPRG